MIKQFGVLALLGAMVSSSFAAEEKLVLDNIQFNLTEKQWVKTSSAKLQVSINATLSNTDLVKTRNEIMENLDKIAKSEWHITQFNRSQDSSGLEKLYVEAQARVPQQVLTNVNVQAKSVSKPGATYTVQNIDFKPSWNEVQKAQLQVRATLYKRIDQELNALNKQYPQQKYSVHAIYFSDGSMPVPERMFKSKVQSMAMVAAPVANISVSNQVQLTALVDVASNRNEE